MNKSYEEIVKELDAKIPRDAISERDGGGGRKLSYLEGHYVIDRLNKVLGPGNWAYTSEANVAHQGTISGKSGETYSVHYITKVRLVVTIGDKPTEFSDYGYGDGSDRNNPGKAHELAVKESVTDGLKRCAKNLGMSMGLALYDKSQENVEEFVPEVKTEITAKPISKSQPVKPKTDEPTHDQVLSGIQTRFNVILSKNLKTKEELSGMVAKYGVDRSALLSYTDSKSLLNELKEILK